MYQSAGYPFGFYSSPTGAVLTQDFSYNVVFFRGIRARLVPHPYRLSDQEKIERILLPRLFSGLSHAYSPVAFTLMLPLLTFSGAHIYLIYCVLNAIGLLLLFRYCLLPRVNQALQLYALAVCAVSICLALSFFLGQSSIVTTSLLGAFWTLLRRRKKSGEWIQDFAMAVLFWALCLKPSVTIIPLALVIGARAWRPLILGISLLAVNWLMIAGYYGGWWTGFWDYLHLLNHYNNADFTPFMRRDYVPGHDGETRLIFALDRLATLGLTLALLILHARRRITLSELFQGLIGIFLLFSPYLLPSEDWILCLLVVEGAFFRYRAGWADLAKLILLVLIVDSQVRLSIPSQINFGARCLFFAWLAGEIFTARREGNKASEDFPEGSFAS